MNDGKGQIRVADARAKTRIGEAKVERILDAALQIFSRFGLRGSRMDQIAEAAGMSKPNLIYYFPSKEALYVAVLERTLGMWLDPLAGIDANMDPAEALSSYISRKLASAQSFPDQSRLFATEIIQGAPLLTEALKRDLAPLVEAKIKAIEGWIAAGKLAPIDPTTLIFMMWATTQHYADFAAQVSVLTGRDLSDPAFFEATKKTILKVILDGILPR
jgi:TetR/AcrR family transcriptional regulator